MPFGAAMAILNRKGKISGERRRSEIFFDAFGKK
jgi:hypothetical protein